MKDRIQRILINEGLTPARMADIMQVQRSSLSHILAGRNKPSMDFMSKLMQSFPSISGHWLLTGQGEMYLDKPKNDAPSSKQAHVSEVDLFKSAPSNEPLRATEPSKSDVHSKSEDETPIITKDKPRSKQIKKIIVIYDDYTTEEIYHG